MPFGPVSGMVRADDSGVESTRSNQLCAAVAPTMLLEIKYNLSRGYA
jgi:hypothetical protein